MTRESLLTVRLFLIILRPVARPNRKSDINDAVFAPFFSNSYCEIRRTTVKQQSSISLGKISLHFISPGKFSPSERQLYE
jgi:hypothetical protein